MKKYKTKKPYYIALIIYFIFLSFRYMQGTDYYSYYYAYFFERNIIDAYNYGFVRDFEFLYNLVVSIFKTFNLSFFTFISCMSGLVLALYNRFFKAYKVDSVVSVILLYMLYGIVFIESALRQGIALALLLGISVVGNSICNVDCKVENYSINTIVVKIMLNIKINYWKKYLK